MFLWLAAFIVGWECVFGISHLRQDNKFMFPPWSTFEACVYEMLSRLAWSVSLGWVTIACAKGWGGLINKFLSWGVFQPLAKISYMTYLTHLTVMNVLWRNTRTYEAEQSYFYQVPSAISNYPHSKITNHTRLSLGVAIFICWCDCHHVCHFNCLCAPLRGSLHASAKARGRR